MELLLVLFVATNIFLALISIPLILQRIPPNGLYGFRVRATLEDPEIWYPVNVYAGQRLFVAGLIGAVFALALYLVPGLTLEVYAYGCLLVFVILSSVGIVSSWRYLRSLSRPPAGRNSG